MLKNGAAPTKIPLNDVVNSGEVLKKVDASLKFAKTYDRLCGVRDYCLPK